MRKPIKMLRLTVYPPDGRVRLAVPPDVDDNRARDWKTHRDVLNRTQMNESVRDV